MRTMEAKELFRQRTKTWFSGANVIFGRQSRIAKPQLSLISITTGDLRRTRFPARQYAGDGREILSYPSRLTVTVDLFTHGSPIRVDGSTVAWADSAMDDMQAFIDFLHSQSTVDWCAEHDIAIQVDGDARDMSGILNEQNYEYRSQITVMLYYTQRTVGRTGVLDEDSLLFERPDKKPGDTGETDRPPVDPGETPENPDRPPVDPGETPETPENPDRPPVDPDSPEGPENPDKPDGGGEGPDRPGETPEGPDTPKEPVYTPEPPPKTEEVTGAPPEKTPDVLPGTVVIPVIRPDTSGAGSEDLAEEENGNYYFTSADIQEDKEEG